MSTFAFNPLKSTEIGSPEKTIRLIKTYEALQNMVDSPAYKVILAGAAVLTKRAEAEAEAEAEASAKSSTTGSVVGSDDGNDDDDSSSTCSDCTEKEEVICNYEKEIESLTDMTTEKFNEAVTVANNLLSDQFLDLKEQFNADFPTGDFTQDLATRLATVINENLTEEDSRMIANAIESGLNVPRSVGFQYISFIGVFYSISLVMRRTDMEDYISSLLGGSYLQDGVFKKLKKSMVGSDETVASLKLHDDLRECDLPNHVENFMTDSLYDISGRTKLGSAQDWPMQFQPAPYSPSLSRGEYSTGIDRTQPIDTPAGRAIIFEKACTIPFRDIVYEKMRIALAKNQSELVYLGWAAELCDTFKTTDTAIHEAKRIVLPSSVKRLVVRKATSSRAYTRSLVDD